MSNNNGFLSNYGKNTNDAGNPAAEIAVNDADLGYKYEQKSGFRKPEYEGGSLPPFRRPKLLVPVIAGAAAVIGVIILLVLLLNGGVAVIDFIGKPLSDAQLWANQNGVMLSTNKQFNDEYDEGTVIAQDKNKGETVKKGEFLTLTISDGHDDSVELDIPDFMSMTADEVQAWVSENYMSKVIITSEFSDTVLSGKVIRFTINNNKVVDKVRRDTSIYVIVSKGPEDQSAIQVTVPDFTTMTVSAAKTSAQEVGLTLVIEEQYNDAPKGSVISQSVKAQEKVSKNSEVKLFVSKGKMVEIPDFSHYTEEQAKAVAANLGINANIIEKYSGSRAGAFLSQKPAAGSIYEEGDYFELTYSLGNQFVLSSYVGQTKDALWNWANDLNGKGARIKIDDSTEVYNSSSPKGTILSQNPVNEVISYSSTIYITVSLGNAVYVPPIVNNDFPAERGYDSATTREEAVGICTDAGLIPKFVTAETFDPARLPGEVIKQGLSAGTKTPEWSVITLTLNPVRTTDKVEVDEFISKSQADIDGEPANAYHKDLTIIFEGTGAAVVAQSVPVGTKVNRGSVIILTLG